MFLQDFLVFLMKEKSPKKIWELLNTKLHFGFCNQPALRIEYSIPKGKLSVQQQLGSIPAHATTSQQDPSGPFPFICNWRNPYFL